MPCWNNVELTRECIDSILRRPPRTLPWELILVNNGSTDGTHDLIEALHAKEPDRFKSVHLGQNKGFCEGMNAGLKIARGHPLWLNNDTLIVQPHTFDAMVSALLSGKNIGAIGPTSNYVMGAQTIQDTLRFIPGPDVQSAKYLIGFCLLVRQDAFKKVGLIHEVFQNYGCDDLDYSIRLREAGYDLAIDRRVFVYHHGCATNMVFGEEDFKRRMEMGTELLKRKWGISRVAELHRPHGMSAARVLWAVPAWGDINPYAYANHMGAFWESMERARHQGIEINPRVMPRSETCRARCEMAEQAMREDYTHLFFLDDDMLFNSSLTLSRLLSHRKPMVSGKAPLRTDPHYQSMFMDFGDQHGQMRYIRSWPENALIEVDSVGMFGCLIETDVFRRVRKYLRGIGEPKRPFFRSPWGDAIYEECPECRKRPRLFRVTSGRLGEKEVGEDFYFCKQVRDAGIPIYVDTSVKFQHIGNPIFLGESQFLAKRDHAARNGLPFAGYDHTGEYPPHKLGEEPEPGVLLPMPRPQMIEPPPPQMSESNQLMSI